MSQADTATGSDLLGVVLAGGASRRFGSPKALATFRGEALWARATRTLGEVGLPTLVIANAAEVAQAIDADVRPDLRPGRGPLGGIETALVSARERGLAGVLVLACDLVLVDAPLLAELLRAWPGTGAAAFRAPGPWSVAPLCSIWATDLLPAVSGALDAGHGSPGALLLEVPVVRLDTVADPTAAQIFRSANHPEALAELEQLESRP